MKEQLTAKNAKKWRKPKRRVMPMPTKLHKAKPDYQRTENKQVIEESLDELV